VTNTPQKIAIVGGSVAGLAVATGLRDEGFDGEILLFDAESGLPYDRPPLSKQIFTSAQDRDTISLTSQDDLMELEIDFRSGSKVVALQASARTFALADGTTIQWDACVIATGSAPISLPGNGMVLRSFDDAIRIQRGLEKANHAIIIGAGVLGCEMAALARKLNTEVEVVDMQTGAMIDRLGPEISAHLEALHRAQDVAFRFGAGVAQIDGDAAAGFRVTFADGTHRETDLVLVAIGCRPTIKWLRDSGLKLDNGVVCDLLCQAVPGIFAAGDVARWFNPRFNRYMRIEHRTNASEQGMAVAANILGAGQPFDPIPFFWTDQYDARIQVHGMIGSDSDVDFLARNENKGFLACYSRNGRVEGALGWNMVRPLREARRFIGEDRKTALANFRELD
jgi:3-phenylpropionate/trans-cinnamate dioxygenase ferredoxin reductase component